MIKMIPLDPMVSNHLKYRRHGAPPETHAVFGPLINYLYGILANKKSEIYKTACLFSDIGL
jgi:hypothetical protein